MAGKKYEYVTKTVYWEGKQYKVRGKSEAEAYEKLGDLKAALKRGEVGISGSMTVAKWSQEWLETYKRGNMTEKSFQTYLDKLNEYIIPGIGKMKLKDVKDVHLQKILNSQAGMSFSHVSKLRMVMTQMFSQARRSRLIYMTPQSRLPCRRTKRNGGGVLPSKNAGRF